MDSIKLGLTHSFPRAITAFVDAGMIAPSRRDGTTRANRSFFCFPEWGRCPLPLAHL